MGGTFVPLPMSKLVNIKFKFKLYLIELLDYYLYKIYRAIFISKTGFQASSDLLLVLFANRKPVISALVV